MVAERGWPLMKMHKYEEAKYWGRKGIESDRDWQKSLGYNVLCATSGEQGIREDSMTFCEGALEHAYESGTGITIDASNACNAAFGVFDFEKAERYAVAATQANDGSTVSAWMNLLYMTLSRGQGESAVSAMQGMQDALASEDPDMRNQKRADVDASFALLLLMSGKAQEAFDKADRALKYPDRRGTISTSEEQSRGSHTTIRYISRKVLAQREAERVASLGFWERFKHWWLTLFGDPDLVLDAAGIRNALSDHERLISTVRPYLDKGLTGVPSWMVGDLVEILGVGVMEAALAEAWEVDAYPKTEGYYAFLSTEIAYQRGDRDEVLEYGGIARSALPQMEQLMKARIYALEGWAYDDFGDAESALESWTQAMELDPSVFRRLGIALPAQFSLVSGLAEEVVNALRRSPRFRESSSGFTVQVEDERTCLLGALGESFHCAPWPARIEGKGDDGEELQTEQEYLTSITESFHEGAFGLSTGLSGSDWNSLDGTTTSSKKAAKKKLESLLKKD
jgi:tetratricopeptide (TPR) repeat protein